MLYIMKFYGCSRRVKSLDIKSINVESTKWYNRLKNNN